MAVEGPHQPVPAKPGPVRLPAQQQPLSWYTYPGDWNGSGISAQYAINLATNGVSAGVDFGVQDPMPCQTNNLSPGTATNPNYSSNPPGTVCTKPAFIPTRILAAGFSPAATD